MAKLVSLSKEQLTQVRKARRICHDLIAEIDKAKRCGTDCEAHEAERANLDRQLEAIEQNYGQ